MRRFFLITWITFALLSVCVVSLPAHAYRMDGDTYVLSLEDCIGMAIAQNQKLKAAGYDMDAAKGQLTEAKARGWPILDYEFKAAPVPRNVDDAVNSFFSGDVAAWFEFKMVLGIPITAFGGLSEARRLAETGVVAARHKVVKERQQVVYDVKKIYYGILFGDEMNRLLTKAIDGLTNKIEEEENAEEPKHSPFEILKMKLYREELMTGRERAVVDGGLALDGLKVQLGLPPLIKVRLDRDQLEPEVVDLAKMEDYVNASMEHRPESKLIEIGVDAKKKLYRLEKFKLAPKLGVGFYFDIGRTHKSIVGVTATDDFNNPFNFTRAGVGLRMTGRIDFHGAYGRIKKARAEYLKSLYEGQMGKKGLRLDAKKAYEDAVKMMHKVVRARKQQSMANQMLFLTKTNYDLGIGDHKEYREALEAVLATRGQYFKTVFDYNVSLAGLERKVGDKAYSYLTGRPNIPVYEAFDSGDDDISMEQGEDTFEEDSDELTEE